MGQTARLNVVNVIDPNQSEIGNPDVRECMVELMFFDSDCDMLSKAGRKPLEQGMEAFHDPNGEDTVGEGERLQIRSVVLALGGPDTKCKNVLPTLEIFDNMTMRTEVFVGNPND